MHKTDRDLPAPDGAACYVYIFGAAESEFIKVGIATDLRRRRFTLRWGNMSGSYPAECEHGDIVAFALLPTRELALRVERLAQWVLARYRVQPYGGKSRQRGGRPEWFQVSAERATQVMNEAVTQVLDRHKRGPVSI